MLDNIRRWLRAFFQAVAPALTIGGIIALFRSLNWGIPDKLGWPYNAIVLALMLVVITVLTATVPALRNLWKAVVFIPYNLLLLLSARSVSIGASATSIV